MIFRKSALNFPVYLIQLISNVHKSFSTFLTGKEFAFQQLLRNIQQCLQVISDKNNNTDAPLAGSPIAASCGVLPARSSVRLWNYKIGSLQAGEYYFELCS